MNRTKLNLSLCKETDINLYFPIELNSDTHQLYEDLQNYGYDLFNINDRFYQDICTPYETENGTDIILSDRINDLYYANNNLTVCQDNCEYSEYISETKLLKCKCNVNMESIDYEDSKKFTPKKIYESFYEVLKYSNYKIIKCYNLIFQGNPFKSNTGSKIVLIFFIFYSCFLIIFLFKGITSLKIDILKSMFNNQIKKELNLPSNINYIPSNNNLTIHKLSNRSRSFHYKRTKKIQALFPPRRKSKKNKTNKINSKNKYNINNISFVDNKINIINNSKNSSFGNFKRKNSNLTENKNINEKQQNKLDDFELNNLEYLEAKEMDKRPFFKIYWSILKREHRIIFTFFIWNDHNLYFIKFMRFIFLVCTDLAMNVIFFTDDSMHKVYLNYGKYDFFQQIPQAIYSLIVSQIIEVFICFLSLTDKHYYQIKDLKVNKSEKEDNKYEIFRVIKCIKLKLLGFFVFTFVFFGFYWYLVTSFCAVYKNTQNIFIKDFLVSFITGLIYPFVLYLFPSILRIISLRSFKNVNLGFVYKLSDIIPIF